MFTDPLKAAFFFTMSQTVLDDLDGIAARRYNQGVVHFAGMGVGLHHINFTTVMILYPQKRNLVEFLTLLLTG